MFLSLMVNIILRSWVMSNLNKLLNLALYPTYVGSNRAKTRSLNCKVQHKRKKLDSKNNHYVSVPRINTINVTSCIYIHIKEYAIDKNICLI